MSKLVRRPWLSLLIPAFEHPEGVIRILDRVHSSGVRDAECLISDDSVSDIVEEAVLRHPLCRAGGVRYRRNRPALGAVENWNSLLESAEGEYLLLMHHDECPEEYRFFSGLKAFLAQADFPDVVFLDCLLPALGARRLRRHMPLWLRRALLAWSPDHLLLHNTVGSPSTVVVRRSHRLLFNTQLKWLVDVDWMVRILRIPGVRSAFSPDLAVISLPHETSITASLGGQIVRLRSTEAQLIRRSLGSSPVFRLLLPRSWAEQAASRIEQAAWLVLRAMIRSTDWVSGRAMPRWLRANS